MTASCCTFFVAPDGRDTNPGTKEQPLATLFRARELVRDNNRLSRRPIRVYLREGTYYLPDTLAFTEEDSGRADAPVIYAAYPSEKAIISGGMPLELEWAPFKDGIWHAAVPEGTSTDQLFIDGKRIHMARYPNFDPNELIFNGYAPDCLDPERIQGWKHPQGGFIHALHKHRWGDFHYRITGKAADGNVEYEGGWQNNRRMGMHETYRFVEHIFEELDVPGEWFLDERQRTLYVYPPEGSDLSKAKIEGASLRHLIEFRGSAQSAVKHMMLRGLTFRHSARTFMDTREPLLRSDWTIYRGGAVKFEDAEDCLLEDCRFDQVGGNAVFVSGYNRRIIVRGAHIADAGANGIAFVGDPQAVRSPLFEYHERSAYSALDLTPGPRGNRYPSDCLVEDCLIYRTGRFEKQSAPVQISMSQHITVRHCTIYEVPRAGINISEGTWGGHLIEGCDVFETVLETNDHGAFNAWGRDRYWGLTDLDLNRINSSPPSSDVRSELPLLDAVEPTILRNNRWRCDHGWDIDLDDGSSHYRIYNNLCLSGGIKLREGFYRVCENNITVNNSLHPHVWYEGSGDMIRRNIVFSPYRPVRVPEPWGRECDYNLLHQAGLPQPEPAVELQRQSKRDAHSLYADALFANPAAGDFTVSEQSPARILGFENFPMDGFGVRKQELRRIARAPKLLERPTRITDNPHVREADKREWGGAIIKTIAGLGEVSASGLPDEIGVLMVSVPAESRPFQLGLREGDVIIRFQGQTVRSADQLLHGFKTVKPGHAVMLAIFRDQQESSLRWVASE